MTGIAVRKWIIAPIISTRRRAALARLHAGAVVFRLRPPDRSSLSFSGSTLHRAGGPARRAKRDGQSNKPDRPWTEIVRNTAARLRRARTTLALARPANGRRLALNRMPIAFDLTVRVAPPGEHSEPGKQITRPPDAQFS